MMKKSVFRAAVFAALFGVFASGAGAQEALPPAVGKPLEKAKAFYNAGRYGEAKTQVNIAAAAATTDGQRFIIEEMRASIAMKSGDKAAAARTYADLLASGRLPASEQLKLIQAEFSIAYGQKNYPLALSWLQKYFKAGGAAPEMRTFQILTYFESGDFASCAKLQADQVNAELRLRQRPTEVQLQTLANCQEHLHDATGFQNTMVQLVTYYPKPDYWANLVHNVQTAPGFSDRLTLDLDRLNMALGTLTKTDDYMEMTELALQGPLPGEAKMIIDKGYAAGVLGTGPEAARQQRLKDLVYKTYASELPQLPKRVAEAQDTHDGNPLVSLGEEYNSYGQYDKGIPLIEAGMRKDELRHPEDTKLHLGLAYMQAGQKAKAIQVLRSVGGKDGTAGLARLWILVINRPA
jgi:hypothetical protein